MHRKIRKFKHYIRNLFSHAYFVPILIISTITLATILVLSIFNSTPRAPKLRTGSGNTLYVASNKIFNSSIGTKDGEPKISFNVGNSGAAFILAGAEKVKPTKSGNTAIFAGVQPNIDLHYTTTVNGLKEELILNQKPDPKASNIFLFDLLLSNVTPKQLTNNFIDPTFKDSKGKYQFHFEKPFAVDANGARTNNVLLQIGEDKQISGKYYMKLIVDDKWLADPTRVYPVSIDPTIVHDTTTEFASGYFDRVKEVGTGYITGATGGTITYADGYTIHTYTSGSSTFTPTDSGNVEVLVVAGGGGGKAGGGGGGGVLSSNSYAGVAATPITVTVGAGGGAATSGSNSVFGTLTAVGGGRGGTNDTTGPEAAQNGGSGGGGGRSSTVNPANGGTGTAGQGYAGGNTNNITTPYPGSGGGGAGGLGNAPASATVAGAGGIGILSNISGTPTYYSGGGGGGIGSTGTGGAGGIGGGGDGDVATGEAGTPNTGGGGGGGVSTGSPGGSGIVIVRYPTGPTLASFYQELKSDANTVGLWHLNEASGNATDSSGNGYTGTATGTTVDAGIFGNGRKFDGISDKFSLGDIGATEKSAYTIEFWAKSKAGAVNPIVYSEGTPASWSSQLLIIYYGDTSAASGGLRVWYQDGLGGGTIITYSTSVADNNWHHVALVQTGPGERLLYLDGKVVGSDTTYRRALATTNAYLGAGNANGSFTQFFNGTLDEVRVSIVARSEDEIKSAASRRPSATYLSPVLDLGGTSWVSSWNPLQWTEFGVATGDGETLKDNTSLVAQWNFNETSGTTADNAEGTAALDGTLTGFASTASQDQAAGTGWTSDNKRWGAGALMFDGTNDNVLLSGNPAAVSFERTNSFSIGSWIKTSNSTSQQQIVSKMANSSPYTGYELFLNTGGFPYFQLINTNGSNALKVQANINVADGNWHYIVATYDGSSTAAGANIYVDGVKQGLTIAFNALSATIVNSNNLDIGARANSAQFFNGNIDSTSVFSRALTPAEILSNYQSGNIDIQTRIGSTTNADDGTWEAWKSTTGETAIEAYDSSDSSLVSYWPMSEFSGNNVADVQGTNPGTNTSTTIVNGVYGKARNFSGTSYITVTDHASLDITGDFTLMAWVYRTGGTNGYIVTKFGPSGGGGYSLLHGNSGEVYCRTDNGTSYQDSYTAGGYVTTSSGWVHVAIARTGSSCRVFINGVDQTGTTATHTTVTANAQPLKIGAASNDNSSPFAGSIDEARVFNTALTATQIKSYMGSSTGENMLKVGRDTNIKMEGTEAQTITSGRAQVDGGTVGLWHLDETGGTGAYVKDSSTLANNVTPTGTTVINGISGKGRSFNGSSDYMTCTDANCGGTTKLDSGGSNWSVSAWVKTGTATRQFVVSKGSSAGQYSYDLETGLNADGRPTYLFLNTIDSIYISVTGANPINDNQWHLLTGTYDGTTASIYVDGNLAGFNTTKTGTQVTNSTGDFLIGARGASGYWNGSLDEIKISNISYTAEEVYENYRLGRDHYITKSITSTDLSSKTSLPFYIAADRPGSYLQSTAGESAYANYQADANTVALLHMDDKNQVTQDLFGGTTIQSNRWAEIDPAANKIAQNTGLVLTAGAAAAWDSAVVSQGTYARTAGQTIYAKFTTGASVAAPNHMMMGWATNSTVTPSYTNINHALYWNAGTFYVYQDGANIGGPYASGYVANTTYEVKIALTTSGTATYSVKGGVYTNWTILLTTDGAKVNTPLRVQVAQYQHTGTFNEITVIPADTVRDSSGTMNNGTTEGVTPIQGKIGQSKNFNGASDNITLGSTSIPDSRANITVDAWIYPTLQTAATHFRVFSEQLVLYVGQYANQASFYMGTGAGWTISDVTGGTLNLNRWNHIAWVKSGTSYYVYINGQLTKSGTGAPATLGTTSNINFIGSYDGTTQGFAGPIDEFRASTVARTATEIRQAYESGLRSHPITIDFGAKLDSGNLITGSGDLGFTVDATYYGLQNKGDALYPGDKIIVKENYDGTEYIAQGTVTAVTASTGAVTVDEWDSGSTFHASGYTANASVFKWQREYWNIDGEVQDTSLDAITNLSLRLTDGNEGRTVYLDDLRSTSGYLTTPAGSTVTSSTGSRYMQYRAILTSTDEMVSPQLSMVTVDYALNGAPTTPTFGSPADTATNQSLTPVMTTTSTDSDSDYLRYKIELCTNVGMSVDCQTFDQTSSQTGWSGQNAQTSTAYTSGTEATYTVQTPLVAGTTYYWRTYAIDPAGTNNWSGTQTPRSFTTSAAPTAPTTPWAEGSTNPTGVFDTTPEFSAIHSDPDSDAANKYEIDVNANNTFTGTVLWASGAVSMASLASGVRSTDVSYAGTAIPLNGAGTTYYWRIRFTDTNNITSAWSATQSFTMNVKPVVPSLDAPSDTALKVNLTPTLQTTTTDPESDYLRYKIELCTDVGMSVDCQTFDQTSSQTGWSGQNAQTNTAYTSGTQATYTLTSNLSNLTTYYWRSYAIDPGGSNSWTTTQSPYSFTTRDLYESFSCLIDETADDSSLTISWIDRETNENSYKLEKSTDGAAFVAYQTLASNSTSYQDTSIAEGHTYQYRVAAYQTLGGIYSPWCTTSPLSIARGTFSFEDIIFR